jgi:hypothetical protein
MRIIPLLLIAFTTALPGFSQCESEPIADKIGYVIATEKVALNGPTEISMKITASSHQTSWRKQGSEAAALTVFVDGKYNQDILLFVGEENLPAEKAKSFDYRIFVGELGKGDHKIEIVLNKPHSAQKIGIVTIRDVQVYMASLASYVPPAKTMPQDSPDNTTFEEFKTNFIAHSNAPFIYARPNAIDKFTDIPLVMYYEIFNKPSDTTRIRYTIIFTNEDGGTGSKALMARWGRMTDIEWIYEIRLDKNGSIISETYQAANHQTLDFKGKRIFGSHPLLYTVTDNNNFSDHGCSTLRFALEAKRADLSAASRESVMERFPWTYRVMADEMFREGRVAANSDQENIVDDPREYIYADIYNDPQAAAVAFEAVTDDGRKLTSDLGNADLRVARPGYFRIALHIPPNLNESSIKEYSIRCYSTQASSDGSCKNVRLVKIVRLNENFEPNEWTLNWPAQTIKTGETAFFSARK